MRLVHVYKKKKKINKKNFENAEEGGERERIEIDHLLMRD